MTGVAVKTWALFVSAVAIGIGGGTAGGAALWLQCSDGPAHADEPRHAPLIAQDGRILDPDAAGSSDAGYFWFTDKVFRIEKELPTRFCVNNCKDWLWVDEGDGGSSPQIILPPEHRWRVLNPDGGLCR